MGASIIICCYNSASRISKTLFHIQKQSVPNGFEWEVLLIDNASSDNTAEVAEIQWLSHPLPNVIFRVINESKPGVANARQTGISNAKHECLIFCDDDNYLDQNFLRIAHSLLERNNLVGAIGGCGEAISDIPIPDWFYEYQDYYATGPQGSACGDITYEKGFVYTAGSVFRRSALRLLQENGFENKLLSKKGSSLLTGEDAEFCYALTLVGYEIWYDSRLKFEHYMPPARLEFSYFLKLVEAYSYSSYFLLPYISIIKKTSRPSWKYSLLWQLLVNINLFVTNELLKMPWYLLKKKVYKLKISSRVRLGALKALLAHPSYHLDTIHEIKNSRWYSYNNK